MLDPAVYAVQAAQGSGDTLIQDAKRIAGQFRPHIAIVDLCLWGDSTPDQSGLEVIAALRSARCILYSAYLRHNVTRQVREERVTWISKTEAPQQLLDAVEHAAHTICALPGAPHIAAPPQWSPAAIVETIFRSRDVPPQSLVHDLIKHLFPDSHTVTVEPLEDETMIAGAVGRGRSVLAKIWREGRRNPMVLKLGPAERIEQEAGNYKRYIEDNLRGRFYADVIDEPRYFWDLGGMLYAFLDTHLNDLSSFAAFYRQYQDPDTILRPLRHLLRDVWGGFYCAPEEPPQPLFAAYDRVLRLQDRLKRPAIQNLAWPPELSQQLKLPNPIDWVQRHKDDDTIPSTRIAITHGDLHADNLFVNPDHAWVIDFERSGPGPILRDVTELEVDILTRLVTLTCRDPTAFCHLAQAIADPKEPDAPIRAPTDICLQDSDSAKALATIQGLRACAHEVIQIEDQREYLWGLLLDALFVASLHDHRAIQQDRALLLSAVLCSQLEQWEA
jgi:hypothetical protein